MATPYSDVHQVFISKITGYSLLNYTDVEREELLLPYLKSACMKFKNICKIDITDRDDDLQQFNQDLDEDTIEILAIGEVYYWLNPKVINEENLYNVMGSKDYSIHSPANLLKELRLLREDLRKEFKQEIINYSFSNGALPEKSS